MDFGFRQNTKLNTLKSQFRRAVRLSSDKDAERRSLGKIQDIFSRNGYPAHVLKSVRRQIERSPGSAGSVRERRRGGTEGGTDRHGRERGAGQSNGKSRGVLLLPYVNETVLCKVKQVARRSGLGVNVASYTPDTLKRKLVHSSLTDPPCPSGSRTCNTCKRISKGRCTDKNVVYQLTCKLCGASYVGESKRPLRLRYNEHFRCAVNETRLTPIGDHFESCHGDISKAEKVADPPLIVKVLKKAKDHPDRKIAESMCIRDLKPRLNDNMSSWRIIRG